MTTYNEPNPDTPRNRGDYDSPHFSPVTPAEDLRTIMINRVSWGAVWAGVALALVTQLVLNLLGAGIGAATIDPMQGESPSAAEFSIGAAIWWTVAGIIAAFIGGYAAGRLAGEPRESSAGWHGLTSWAASILVLAVIVTMGAGALIGGSLNALGVAATASDEHAGISSTISRVGQQAQEAVRDIAPAAGEDAAAGTASGIFGQDQSIAQPGSASPNDPVVQDYQRARDGTMDPGTGTGTGAATGGTSTGGVNGRTETTVQDYRQTERTQVQGGTSDMTQQDARETADDAAKGVSRAALLASIALMLGAIAAWLGGRAGAVKPTVTSGRLRVQEPLH